MESRTAETWIVVDGLCDACRANQVVFYEDLSTALRVVSFSGHSQCLHQLLAAGADVNSVNAACKTAVLCAAESGIEQAVRLLIRTGADVNIAAKNDENALMAAAVGGHSRCVTLLLSAGADVNAVNNVGTSPLIVAVRKCTDVIVDFLIEKGAYVNVVTMSCTTSLLEALQCRYYPRLCGLIKAGADINARDADGSTPLIKAAVLNIKFSRLFLRCGARINLVNEYNRNALRQHIYRRRDKYPQTRYASVCHWGDVIVRKNILVLSNELHVPVPKYLTHEEATLCPAHMCRESIRNHLLQLDPHENLFVRVKRLGLPRLLYQYLLFYAQIDNDDDHHHAIPAHSSPMYTQHATKDLDLDVNNVLVI